MVSKQAIAELVSGLCGIFGNEIYQIILYGSVARNEASADSDIEQKNMEKWGNILPFYKNIKKEGVVLWTAA